MKRRLWPQEKYEAYRLTGKEILLFAAAGILAGGAIGFLFFRHAAGLLTAFPVTYALLRTAVRKKTTLQKKNNFF